MIPWKTAKGEVKIVLRQKSILYKSVKNVEDVVLVSAPNPATDTTSKEEVNDLSR